MFCKSCGKQIDNDSAFCSFCGTKQSISQKLQIEAYKYQSIIDTEKNINNETNFDKAPNIVRRTKYDPTYKKEVDVMVVGIILLSIVIILAIIGPFKFENRETYGQYQTSAVAVSLLLRICVTSWVVNIAKRQNRETSAWGLLAFLLPSIALIIIATRKKLFANIQIIEELNSEQNSKILSDKAEKFLIENKYAECIRFSEKAIELNPNNKIATSILNKGKEAVSGNNNFGSLIHTGFCETTDGIILKIVSKLNKTIGAEVFTDDLPTPNGIYNYKEGTHKTHKIIIENGKIKERYFIINHSEFYAERKNEYVASVGDKVFKFDGTSLPNGKYKMGFLMPKMIVENGEIIKFI